MRILKKFVCCFMIFIITIGASLVFSNQRVTATTKTTTSVTYVTIRDFIQKLVTAMKLDVDQNITEPYITAALDEGILKTDDFSDFDAKITRTDCAVLLNRVDESLHGETLEESYIQRILDRRISDIKKIDKIKQEAVAKIYGKGIIRGYSKGVGVQSREFRGEQYITNSTAKNFINLTLNPSKRSKLSPDGQLIRTTNLPKNADKFDYILECFPNEFYEKPFEMETGTLSGYWVEGENIDYPVNMKNQTFKNWYTSYEMKEQMDLYLYDIADYVEQYVKLIFNINYKTLDKDWCNDVKAVSYNPSKMDQYLENYILHAKYYKSVVETRKVAVEPSTFYEFGGEYIRVYVEYKVTAKELVKDGREYIFANKFYDPNLKIGKWMTGYFDITLVPIDGTNGDMSTLRPSLSVYTIQ